MTKYGADRNPRLFDGFGDCLQTPRKRPNMEEVSLPGAAKTRRELIRARVPPRPGVYGMIDENDHLIYVGKSKRLRSRLLQYFYRGPPPKAKRIVARTKRLVWEPAPHEFGALLRELELIARFLPRFNVQGKPGRLRRCFLYLMGKEAPAFRVDSRPAKDAKVVFGPLPAPQQCRWAAQRLNYYYRLRDCPQRVRMYFADQLDLFPADHTPQCLRYELDTCLGPCAAGCRRDEYAAQVEAARRFLCGDDSQTLVALEQAMHEASKNRRFERAAALRDTWLALSWLRQQLDRLQQVLTEYSFVYPLRGYAHRRSWYVVEGGRLAGVIGDPLRKRKAAKTLAFLEQVFASSAKPRPSDDSSDDAPSDRSATYADLRPRSEENNVELETLQLIGAWFRRRPQELLRTLPPKEALRQCRQAQNASTSEQKMQTVKR